MQLSLPAPATQLWGRRSPREDVSALPRSPSTSRRPSLSPCLAFPLASLPVPFFSHWARVTAHSLPVLLLCPHPWQ